MVFTFVTKHTTSVKSVPIALNEVFLTQDMLLAQIKVLLKTYSLVFWHQLSLQVLSMLLYKGKPYFLSVITTVYAVYQDGNSATSLLTISGLYPGDYWRILS